MSQGEIQRAFMSDCEFLRTANQPSRLVKGIFVHTDKMTPKSMTTIKS